ncbi:hypothetical protein F4777DRAFT_592885 [Nemania sp. FL0916]|nr:hypothetical protein F4777DRAFT_592885 [Nemania sp. FL0916]
MSDHPHADDELSAFTMDILVYNEYSGESAEVKVPESVAKLSDEPYQELIYRGTFHDHPVTVKIWGVGATAAGQELLEMYESEKLALQTLEDLKVTPRILFDGYYLIPNVDRRAKVLITEWREGRTLRSCWRELSQHQRNLVRTDLLNFFHVSLKRGIYHDGLRHLESTLWDEQSMSLTIMDFERAKEWDNEDTTIEMNDVAVNETAIILEAAYSL